MTYVVRLDWEPPEAEDRWSLDRVAYPDSDATPQGYPFVRFNTTAKRGAKGGLLVLDLEKAMWFVDIDVAFKALLRLTGTTTNYGSIAVFAVTLK